MMNTRTRLFVLASGMVVLIACNNDNSSFIKNQNTRGSDTTQDVTQIDDATQIADATQTPDTPQTQQPDAAQQADAPQQADVFQQADTAPEPDTSAQTCDNTCPKGQVCSAGKCVPQGYTFGACKNDDDCGGGECTDKFGIMSCDVLCDVETECNDDNFLCLEDANNSPGWCYRTCDNNDDCKTDETCEIIAGITPEGAVERKLCSTF